MFLSKGFHVPGIGLGVAPSRVVRGSVGSAAHFVTNGAPDAGDNEADDDEASDQQAVVEPLIEDGDAAVGTRRGIGGIFQDDPVSGSEQDQHDAQAGGVYGDASDIAQTGPVRPHKVDQSAQHAGEHKNDGRGVDLRPNRAQAQSARSGEENQILIVADSGDPDDSYG